MSATQLKRSLGVGLLVFYGVGVMVGAGIYVLIGAVAGSAGIYAPLAFMVAGLIAAPTALSYAELSSRIPEAAGEAAYVDASFQRQWLVILTGISVVLVGLISAAAVMRGGIGYLNGMVSVDTTTAAIVMGLALMAVAIVGALESLVIAALFTVVEVLGLLAVSAAGLLAAPSADWVAVPSLDVAGVGMGAVLAFFAFIGFEDMVNMAEETCEPEKTMPKAIVWSLICTTVLYGLVSWAAVRSVGVEALANSEQPLALVWEQSVGKSAAFLSVIAVIAALNGILAQMVMASRVLMGMGRRYHRMRWFAWVYPRFGTPVIATALVGVLVIGISIMAPVRVLAEITSTFLLLIFILVNASLVVLKKAEPAAGFRVPMWVPVSGVVASLMALLASFILG